MLVARDCEYLPVWHVALLVLTSPSWKQIQTKKVDLKIYSWKPSTSCLTLFCVCDTLLSREALGGRGALFQLSKSKTDGNKLSYRFLFVLFIQQPFLKDMCVVMHPSMAGNLHAPMLRTDRGRFLLGRRHRAQNLPMTENATNEG